MTKHLLSAILAHPDDDALRLAYADDCDARNDPRGEFIRLQLRASAAEHSGAPTALFRPWEYAADDLFKAHGDAWIADLCPPCAAPIFVRGFVEHVRLSVRDFLDHGSALLNLAPIRHLDLTDARDLAAQLFASPLLASIRSLNLDRCGLGDAEIAQLASSPHLSNLEWLELMRNDIGMPGVRTLAAAKHVQRLRYVGFFGNRVDPTEEIFTDQGSVVDRALPAEGIALEKEFGHIPWLHLAATNSWDVPPRRY